MIIFVHADVHRNRNISWGETIMLVKKLAKGISVKITRHSICSVFFGGVLYFCVYFILCFVFLFCFGGFWCGLMYWMFWYLTVQWYFFLFYSIWISCSFPLFQLPVTLLVAIVVIKKSQQMSGNFLQRTSAFIREKPASGESSLFFPRQPRCSFNGCMFNAWNSYMYIPLVAFVDFGNQVQTNT